MLSGNPGVRFSLKKSALGFQTVTQDFICYPAANCLYYSWIYGPFCVELINIGSETHSPFEVFIWV